jgi:hypothetical protein
MENVREEKKRVSRSEKSEEKKTEKNYSEKIINYNFIM